MPSIARTRAADDPLRHRRLDQIERLFRPVVYMRAIGPALPTLTASLVIAIEIIGGIALVLGAYMRRLALLFAVNSLATAFFGYRCWTINEIARGPNLYDFCQKVGVAGGFFLLSSAREGRYSIDHRRCLGGAA